MYWLIEIMINVRFKIRQKNSYLFLIIIPVPLLLYKPMEPLLLRYRTGALKFDNTYNMGTHSSNIVLSVISYQRYLSCKIMSWCSQQPGHPLQRAHKSVSSSISNFDQKARFTATNLICQIRCSIAFQVFSTSKR